MPAQLLALTDGPSILLDKPIMLFGRHPECDIQLNSRKVSRKHCCIAQVNDYLVVRDLGSTNGIRINGSRVTEGKLRTGDELTIGNFRYQVFWDSPNGSAVRRAVPSVPRSGDLPAPPGVNDDALEQADEPVELDSLPPGIAPLPARPVDATPPEPPDPPRRSDSCVLPDNITLPPPEPRPNPSSRSGHSL
ncbi:MAG TPA: FHA domain-containing protein [Gemmataceae bacterium]